MLFLKDFYIDLADLPEVAMTVACDIEALAYRAENEILSLEDKYKISQNYAALAQILEIHSPIEFSRQTKRLHIESHRACDTIISEINNIQNDRQDARYGDEALKKIKLDALDDVMNKWRNLKGTNPDLVQNSVEEFTLYAAQCSIKASDSVQKMEFAERAYKEGKNNGKAILAMGLALAANGNSDDAIDPLLRVFGAYQHHILNSETPASFLCDDFATAGEALYRIYDAQPNGDNDARTILLNIAMVIPDEAARIGLPYSSKPYDWSECHVPSHSMYKEPNAFFSQWLEEMLEEEPGNSKWPNLTSLYHYHTGEKEKAFKIIDKAISGDMGSECVGVKAHLLRQEKLFEEAEKVLIAASVISGVSDFRKALNFTFRKHAVEKFDAGDFEAGIDLALEATKIRMDRSYIPALPEPAR